MIILLCGLSGAGKTTIASQVYLKLQEMGMASELIDGDEYRRSLCKDLSFSKADRLENLRRLAFVAEKLSKHEIITIISAISPYEEIRKELKSTYENFLVVHIHCELNVLIERDTKGLYKRALLPDGHPDKLLNLTGINDEFEYPQSADLLIETSEENVHVSSEKLFKFIKAQVAYREQHVLADVRNLGDYRKVI